MSKPKSPVPSLNTNNAKLDRKSRLSLPQKEKLAQPSTSQQRRNTISEYDTSKTKKKSKAPLTPTIHEDEDEIPSTTTSRAPAFVIENETSRVNRQTSNASLKSALSTRSSKASNSYDNLAFEGNLKSGSSSSANPGSTNTVRNTSRPPSIHSGVYQEQYCCFAKRTKCERYLYVVVIILVIIIIVLVIVIAVLAKNNKEGIKLPTL